MRINRFFGLYDLKNDRIAIQDQDVVHQIKDVLRLRVGDELVLCDGKMNEALGVILEIGRDTIQVGVVERSRNKNEYSSVVTLYMALLKNENFEFAAQKTTEIGIKRIVPVISERTVKTDFKKTRLEKIIKEAAEQSGRGIIPILEPAMTFEQALYDADLNQINLLLDKSGGRITALSKYKKIGIFVGPEGGFGNSEILLAKKTKFKIAVLGKLTLRAETAAIIASYRVLDLLM